MGPILRVVVANVALFAIYLAVGLLGTWSYVARGQVSAPIDFLAVAFLCSALPAVFAVDWYLLRRMAPVRRAIACFSVGTASLGLGFAAYFVTVIEFHLMIGGTL